MAGNKIASVASKTSHTCLLQEWLAKNENKNK